MTAPLPVPSGGRVTASLVEDDPTWGPWSQTRLEALSGTHRLFINPVTYFELSIGYRRIDVNYLVDRDRGDFKMKGIYFGGVVRY